MALLIKKDISEIEWEKIEWIGFLEGNTPKYLLGYYINNIFVKIDKEIHILDNDKVYYTTINNSINNDLKSISNKKNLIGFKSIELFKSYITYIKRKKFINNILDE